MRVRFILPEHACERTREREREGGREARHATHEQGGGGGGGGGGVGVSTTVTATKNTIETCRKRCKLLHSKHTVQRQAYQQALNALQGR